MVRNYKIIYKLPKLRISERFVGHVHYNEIYESK